MLDAALAQLPVDPKVTPVTVRADSAGCSHGFLDVCRVREVRFIVGHPLTVEIANVVVGAAKRAWIPAVTADRTDERDNAEVVEITGRVDLSDWPAGTRMIVRREDPHPGAQLTLTDVDGHRYQVGVTDDPDPDVAYLEARYRGRAERRICDHKDTGLAKFPSASSAINTAWLELTLIAGDLFAWTRTLALGDKFATAEPKRLRYTLLHAAGILVRHATTRPSDRRGLAVGARPRRQLQPAPQRAAPGLIRLGAAPGHCSARNARPATPESRGPFTPSNTYQGYALLRSVLKSGSDADVAQAITYSTRVRLYPLAQADDPPETKYLDATGVVFDSTIRYDLCFFEALNAMIQAEPWLERDKAMIDPLKTIGIERGKRFEPDATTKQILEQAILEAKAWFEANYGVLPPFYDGAHWFFPIGEEMHRNVMSFWTTPDSYPIDNGGLAYTFAFFSGVHVGEAQYYLMSIHDADGEPLDGNASHRLRVPTDAPVTQYWSMTVYNRATHTFIREAARVGRSSQAPGLHTNTDGSADIYFGPTPPTDQEPNWVPTDPNGRFEVLARFYGPNRPCSTRAGNCPTSRKPADPGSSYTPALNRQWSGSVSWPSSSATGCPDEGGY